ncbi:hypothetical protein GIB67_035438 [Kingdonia uniflora]|uniref:FLZ-type domain-containing protein n=1 Tax=Kingdonia uniflora TaxID=39325 RepID=A0A7J7P117_9MAGN|nr:hypothetical protein GIB67_035438 [Kingdonia uniflora]
MLRKRSRSVQKDHHKDHLMPESASEVQADGSGQKHKSGSFFSVPGLFVGFNLKGVTDFDSAKSPTSPLEFKVFASLGNPFRSPRSSGLDGGPQKSWDCGKVGLGIVDSLVDDSKPLSGKVIGLSRSKNILFGSQMKMNISSSPSHPHRLIESSGASSPKSLPKNYAISPNTKTNSPEETQLGCNPIGKIRSCASDFGKSLPLSSLINSICCNPNSSSEDFWSDENNRTHSSFFLDCEKGQNIDDFLGIKPSSLPISIGQGLLGSLSVSEIELSEDYTCVVSHGPNPRITHIFGDCVLESHANNFVDYAKKVEGVSSQAINKSLPFPSENFLSSCYFCKKKLVEGKDIYMYRGEKAFCSSSCRDEEILVEEEMEKFVKNSPDNAANSDSCTDIFLAGIPVAT